MYCRNEVKDPHNSSNDKQHSVPVTLGCCNGDPPPLPFPFPPSLKNIAPLVASSAGLSKLIARY